MPDPRIHRTPLEAIGPRVRETVTVAGREYVFERPVGLHHLFEHPAVRSAYAEDEYIPYWADLWPAARLLADVVSKETWQLPCEALELGCGLGLSGLVALHCGLSVTFSDVDEAAVQLAASNARLNGFHDFETAAIDLRAAPPRQFPVILAADVCYEVRLTEAVAEFIQKGLAPGGVALVADAERSSAKSFRSLIERRGMKIEVTDLKVSGPGETSKGQIYRIEQQG